LTKRDAAEARARLVAEWAALEGKRQKAVGGRQ